MVARKSKDVLEEIHELCLDKSHRIIYVHSEFRDEESGVNWEMASRFIKNLDYLNSLSNEPITIKLLTFGGCWNSGMAMYDAIKNSKSHITSESFAHARSMSSIIIQAADTRRIHKNTDFMVHWGTYGCDGDFRAVTNGIKHYEKSNDVMLNIYTGRCIDGQFAKDKNIKPSQLKAYIKKQIDKKTDWWMTAEEAVYMGFVDEII